MRNTVNHPGITLKMIIDGRGLSVRQAANQIGIGHVTLFNIVNAKTPITPAVAAKLQEWEEGFSAEAWLFAQGSHELNKIREEATA